MPGMANDTRIELRLPTDLLARIDGARGLVPRAAFVRQALEDAVGDGGGFPPADTTPAAVPVGRTPHPEVPVSEEAPVAASGERIPSRPTPPRGQPKAERKAKATDALSTALARQQALNKSKK